MIQMKDMLELFPKMPLYYNIPSKHAQEKCLKADFLGAGRLFQKKCLVVYYSSSILILSVHYKFDPHNLSNFTPLHYLNDPGYLETNRYLRLVHLSNHMSTKSRKVCRAWPLKKQPCFVQTGATGAKQTATATVLLVNSLYIHSMHLSQN